MSPNATILVAIIAAIGSMVAAWLSHRTHRSVNSRMDEIIKLVKQVGHAEGVKEESDRRDNLVKE